MKRAMDNAEQIADWNGALGRRWAELQRDLDAMIMPFGRAALDAAAPSPGQRVLDIGCGCGETSIQLARQVGKTGAVVGVDVSRPMLAVARARLASGPLAQLAQLSFREADASAAELPAGNDLLFSCFGVMFFQHPAVAFGQMRKWLRPGGRCVFVCWRKPRDNAWAMTPLMAARQAMKITPAAADPLAPGPFAFADEERLTGILVDAGFGDIAVQRFDAAVVLGATPRVAAENAAGFGPVSRLLREVGSAHLPILLDAMEQALGPLAAADGRVSLPGSTWIASATNPG